MGIPVGCDSGQLLLDKGLAYGSTRLLIDRKGALNSVTEGHDGQNIIVSEVGQKLFQRQEDIGELGSVVHGARDIQNYYNVDGLLAPIPLGSGQTNAGHGVKEFTIEIHLES
jgi:hypothetical protein